MNSNNLMSSEEIPILRFKGIVIGLSYGESAFNRRQFCLKVRVALKKTIIINAPVSGRCNHFSSFIIAYSFLETILKKTPNNPVVLLLHPLMTIYETSRPICSEISQSERIKRIAAITQRPPFQCFSESILEHLVAHLAIKGYYVHGINCLSVSYEYLFSISSLSKDTRHCLILFNFPITSNFLASTTFYQFPLCE